MTGGWKYTNNERTVVYRVHPTGEMESCVVTREDVQEWIANGNTPEEPDNL